MPIDYTRRDRKLTSQPETAQTPIDYTRRDRKSTSQPAHPAAPDSTHSSRPRSIDWSNLNAVRSEWPGLALDPAADLASWRSGRQIYDVNDDYDSMTRAGALMCPALAHHLYGDGILSGSDLPETVHRVLFASTAAPPDGATLSEQARRQLRLGLTVMKKHGWQPVALGGDGAMENPFFHGGTRILLAAAIAPGERLWEGDLQAFFTTHPIDIQPPPAYDAEKTDALIASMQSVLDRADAGDAASKARVRGFAAQHQGDIETALRHHEDAARLGDVDAMFDAGCINNDLGRAPASTYWWEAAARGGHANAAHNLAVGAHRDGNLALAQQWYQRAGELGDSRGYAALTQMASDAGDAQGEMHWSRLGAEAGHPFCLVRHGQRLAQANENNPAMLRHALTLLERAAAMGDADGMFLAGIGNGQLGNASEARRWLEQADRAGHPRARAVIQKYGL